MDYTVRPISDRTAFTGEQSNSPFSISWSQLMDEFDRELWFLDATDVVIEVDVEERHIRVDGMLRADAKTKTPAVRLAFNSKYGPIVYATDAFERPAWRRQGMQQDWQHNLCAIVRGLEALRKVDRYGISRRGEQYQGYKAIGTGPAIVMHGGMTQREACHLLTQLSGVEVTPGESEQSLRARLRTARAAAHPDRNNGDRSLWDQVELAAKVFGLAP